MTDRPRLAPNLKYPWQEAVLDALRQDEPKGLPDKIKAAERSLSERLVQDPTDPDERLALRGAVIALECLRHATMDKC
jgi:hypothetical protein